MGKFTHNKFIEKFKNNNKNFINIEILGKYEGADSKIKCRCKIDGHEWFPTASQLANQCSGCPKCSGQCRKTHQEFLQEVNKIEKLKNIIYLTQYKGGREYIECLCLIHNYNFKVSGDNILRQHTGCPKCFGTRIFSNHNDMWTKNKELAKLLLNPEDGYKYGINSRQRIDWRCPNCGNIIKNKPPVNMKKLIFGCQLCSDKISYPQRLIGQLLKNMSIFFETEKSFDWCEFKLNNKNMKCRYDFYFEINNKKYLLEADGGFHFDKIHLKSTRTIEEYKFIDSEKDRLAKEKGYIVIRIDCRYSDINYIKESVLKSELKELFDLSGVDWEEIHRKSLKSKVIEACELWNSGIKSLIKIGKILKLNSCTISKYLSKMAKMGLCNYNSETNKNRKVVCKNTREIFSNIRVACKFYNCKNVWESCNNKRKFSGIHPQTQEKLVWEYYNEEKHKDFILIK